MEERQKQRRCRLELWLEENGRSYAWLAKALGVSRVFIHHCVHGTKPWPEGYEERISAICGQPIKI